MRVKKFIKSIFFSVLICCISLSATHAQKKSVAFSSTKKLAQYVQSFNAQDTETVVNHIPNSQSYEWLAANIPIFECPDSIIEKIYYYRWWTKRKHLKKTPDGYVFTEFITPMNHGGKYNTISSALGHHIYEGRWLRDPEYIKQYINFWIHADKQTAKPHLHAFSSWLQDAIYGFYLVNKDKSFIAKNLLALNEDYNLWEAEKQLPDGKFWQYDVRDAMEESISGGRKVKNVRPTINSYMYGNAVAMEKMAKLTGNDTLKEKYRQKAKFLKTVVNNYLWDDTASFYKVKFENGQFCDAREAIGFIPWYFNIPPDGQKYAKQWDQLTDTAGFRATWGLTTAERRHPGFRTHGSGHGCEWDGALWPFATTQTLRGLSNLLYNYKARGSMNEKVFYDEFKKYAWSHQKNGKPYIGEYQDEKNGYWLKGDNPRSSYYNHSSFADLVISDLVGLKPTESELVILNPLIPQGTWDWFLLDKLPYHGKLLTIIWDKTGTHYKKGKGLQIYADGIKIHQGNTLGKLTAKLK